MSSLIRRQFKVYGRVQGVGYRYFCLEKAEQIGLKGWVRNEIDRSVLCEAEGCEASVGEFKICLEQGPSFSRVERVEEAHLAPKENEVGFEIRY